MWDIWPRKTRIQQKRACWLMRFINKLKSKVGGSDGGMILIAKWVFSLCLQQKTSGLMNDFLKRSRARVWMDLLRWKCYSHFTNCELLLKETASYEGCKLKDMTGLTGSWQHYIIRYFISGYEAFRSRSFEIDILVQSPCPQDNHKSWMLWRRMEVIGFNQFLAVPICLFLVKSVKRWCEK